MNISFNKQENNTALLTISLQEADYQPKVEKKVKELAKTAQIKGFRPGKVPATHLKRLYGASITSEVIDEIIGETLDSYLKENKIETLGQPLLNKDSKLFDYGKDTEVEVTFDLGLSPEFEMPDFSAFSIKRYSVEVAPEEVEKTIADLRERLANTQAVEVSEKGHQLFGLIKKEGAETEKQTLIPTNQVEEGALELFLGKKAGDLITFDIRAAFKPEHIRHVAALSKEEAEAAEGQYHFTVTEVKSVEPAAFDADFFGKVLGDASFDNEEAFRAELKRRIEANYTNDSTNKSYTEAKATILESFSGLVLPEEFLKRWLLVVNAKNKVTPEQIEAEYPMFKKDIVWDLLRAKVAVADKIQLDEAKIKDFTRMMISMQLGQMGLHNVGEDQLNNFTENYLSGEKGENYRKAAQDTFNMLADEAIFGKVTFVSETINADEFAKVEA